MSFSAFTISEGICSTSISETNLPTCPILTFDLILLHLLSTLTLCLLLVVLSTALSPGYYLSHSRENDGTGVKDDPESVDMLVMWDLALASSPSSPRLGASTSAAPGVPKTYGTADPALVVGETTSTEAVARKDKFAQGRLVSYSSLLLCSLGVLGASILSIINSPGRYGQFSHSFTSGCQADSFSDGQCLSSRDRCYKHRVHYHLVSYEI